MSSMSSMSNLSNIITGWYNVARNELGILPDNIKQLAEKRLKSCSECPQRKESRCGVCNCYLIAKTKDPESKCPIMRWEIMKGIYFIKNLVNGKYYIGISNNLKNRKSKHFSTLKRNIHKNKHLQASYNRYGKENFVFEILLKTDSMSMLELEKMEKELIKVHTKKVGTYNKTIGRGYWSDRKTNQEFIKICTKNIRKAHALSKIKIRVINKVSKEIQLFDSYKEASKKLGIDVGSISKIINKKGSFKSAKGFFIKKVNV